MRPQSSRWWCGAVMALAAATAVCDATDRPIIGIIAQETVRDNAHVHYLASSYVKFIESAGARVVPVPSNITSEQAHDLYQNLNGIVFPGGGADPSKGSELYATGKIFTDLARQDYARGEIFPVYGICLGLQLLSIITAEGLELDSCADTDNVSLPLVDVQMKQSHLYDGMRPEQYTTLTTTNSTVNFHEFCVWTKTFRVTERLGANLNILSTNRDGSGMEFVSSMEHKTFPFYATQFHPEKVMYEWVPGQAIQRTAANVDAMQLFANRLVDDARKSTHAYPSIEEENSALIYNFDTVYQPSHHLQNIYLF